MLLKMTDSEKLTMKITKMNIVANWDISDGTDTFCKLCRLPLIAPSLQELSGEKNMLGKLVVGACGHIFHQECMNDFINTGCVLCPIDKNTWELSKTIKSGAIYEKNKQVNAKIKK